MNLEPCVIFLTQPAVALLQVGLTPVVRVLFAVGVLLEWLADYAEPLARGGDEL